jgi:hypothetical protein
VAKFYGPRDLLVFADRGLDGRPSRAEALAVVARAAVDGRALVIRGGAELERWIETLEGADVAERRPLRRLAILGESGVGKTVLAGKIGPALGLPLVSLDHELWWRHDRERGWRGRIGHLERRTDEESWLAEGVYRNVAMRFARRADMTIFLDLPSSVARRQREARGKAEDAPLHQRLLVAGLRASYPHMTAPLIRRDLSRIAHRAAVLRVRTAEERAAVTAALLSRAADGSSSTG